MENVNLEEMRNQFAILKEQLKKQEIVSDRLIRETMKAKTSAINNTKRMSYVCAALAISILSYEAATSNALFSIPLTLFTDLMLLSCVCATHYIHKPVDKLDFMQQDFATVARVMAKFKRQYDNWLHYVTPSLLIPWLGWICYEQINHFCPEDSNPILYCIPIFIGAFIGGFIGYKFHTKATHAAQDIIKDIEEI